MCQLILGKTKDRRVFAPCIINLMLEDTGFRNRDGAGLWSSTAGLVKTKEAFNTVSWRNFFNKNSSNTVIGHVRAGTLSKTGKKEITEENSHPYVIDGCVFAHNGTLTTKEDYTPKAQVPLESTDSLNFFSEVSYYRKKENLSVIDAIKRTMEFYTGKFAFLVYDGVDYYAIRGRTATLHKATITADDKPIAVFVNTEESDLKNSMPLMVHLYALIYDSPVNFKIEALEKESIYRLEDLTLTKIDEIKENDAPTKTIVVADTYDDDYWGRGYGYSGRTYSTAVKHYVLHYFNIEIRRALDTLLKLKISPELFDKWSVACLGIPATCLEEKQLLSLVEFIDDFNTKCTTGDSIVADYKSNSKKIHELITKIRKAGIKEAVYWPFELNTVEDLEMALEGVE